MKYKMDERQIQEVNRSAAGETLEGKYVGCFFIGITTLCFITLTLMSKYSKHRKRKNEEKYSS